MFVAKSESEKTVRKCFAVKKHLLFGSVIACHTPPPFFLGKNSSSVDVVSILQQQGVLQAWSRKSSENRSKFLPKSVTFQSRLRKRPKQTQTDQNISIEFTKETQMDPNGPK